MSTLEELRRDLAAPDRGCESRTLIRSGPGMSAIGRVHFCRKERIWRTESKPCASCHEGSSGPFLNPSQGDVRIAFGAPLPKPAIHRPCLTFITSPLGMIPLFILGTLIGRVLKATGWF